MLFLMMDGMSIAVIICRLIVYLDNWWDDEKRPLSLIHPVIGVTFNMIEGFALDVLQVG